MGHKRYSDGLIPNWIVLCFWFAFVRSSQFQVQIAPSIYFATSASLLHYTSTDLGAVVHQEIKACLLFFIIPFLVLRQTSSARGSRRCSSSIFLCNEVLYTMHALWNPETDLDVVVHKDVDALLTHIIIRLWCGWVMMWSWDSPSSGSPWLVDKLPYKTCYVYVL